jgi:VWFA-related protein
MFRVARLLPFVLLCPAAVLAQTPRRDTIQVTSRIVYVDVVVRDHAGHIVRGLTESDFRIFENGKPQTITYFVDHTRDTTVSIPAKAEGSGLEFSNVGGESQSANIILFDFFNTASQDQLYARKQMIRFLEELPPGKRTALFVLGWRLKMLQNFTGSTDRLLAAAKAMKFESSTMQTAGEQQQDSDMAAAFAAAMGGSPSGQNPVADGNAFAAAENAQHAADVTQTALNEISAAVSGYPGRKNLYWLADTFPLYGGPALEINDMANAMSNYSMSTQDMAAANRAEANGQIAIYPISLLGLDASGMGAEARGMTSASQLFTAREAMREMMNNLADTTGGRAYYGTNDFAGALRNGFEDGSSYYSLAYEPQNKKWNGQFRKLAVKLAERGYSLNYRRGYYALPDHPAHVNDAVELNAALQPDTPEITMLLLRAKVQLPDKDHPAVRVDPVIEPANVDFSTDAAGRHHARLLVSLIALPENNPSGKSAKAPVQTSGTYVVQLDTAAFQKLLSSGMPMHLELRLAPGCYRLRLGVSDMNNHHVGTLDMPIQIPGATGNSPP